MRRLAFLLMAVALSGCTSPSDLVHPTTSTPDPPVISNDPRFPPLQFGGLVMDALSGDPVHDAEVHLDLAAKVPCRHEGLVWNQYTVATSYEGRYGPFEGQRPRTDDFAYFLHVRAPGYAENVTYIGPTEARGDLGNLTVVLHPAAAISGTAPPGTVVALDAPGFPILVAADANGTWRIEPARVAPASLVIDLESPYTSVEEAPAQVEANATNGTGWSLQGVVRAPNGATLVADVVARNATGALVGAARSGDDGVFTMSVPAIPGDVRLFARTGDGHFGAALPVTLNGAPATRFSLLTTALC